LTKTSLNNVDALVKEIVRIVRGDEQFGKDIVLFLEKYEKEHLLIFSRFVYEKIYKDIDSYGYKLINFLDIASMMLNELINSTGYSAYEYISVSEKMLVGTKFMFFADKNKEHRQMLITIRWLILHLYAIKEYLNAE